MKQRESEMEAPLTIRPFDGSLADAEGLLAVERATFNESPYTPEQVRTMLAEGPQRAWLAVQGESVTGFAVGFPVTGLRGSWWEVDLLAVHPEWRGRRLGHRLIEAAMAHGAGVARKARALVADDNGASEQAFLRAGFRVTPGARELFILRPGEAARGHRTRWNGHVREASSRSEALECLASLPGAVSPAGMTPEGRGDATGEEPRAKGLTLLLAEQGSDLERARPAGCAELVEVQTLLYHGVWIESLRAASPGACEALVEQAVERVCEAGLDEIGAVVHEQDWTLQRTLRSAGFRSLGGFRWLVAQMPDGSKLS